MIIYVAGEYSDSSTQIYCYKFVNRSHFVYICFETASDALKKNRIIFSSCSLNVFNELETHLDVSISKCQCSCTKAVYLTTLATKY